MKGQLKTYDIGAWYAKKDEEKRVAYHARLKHYGTCKRCAGRTVNTEGRNACKVGRLLEAQYEQAAYVGD